VNDLDEKSMNEVTSEGGIEKLDSTATTKPGRTPNPAYCIGRRIPFSATSLGEQNNVTSHRGKTRKDKHLSPRNFSDGRI